MSYIVIKALKAEGKTITQMDNVKIILCVFGCFLHLKDCPKADNYNISNVTVSLNVPPK